jgi:hypothetical protein
MTRLSLYSPTEAVICFLTGLLIRLDVRGGRNIPSDRGFVLVSKLVQMRVTMGNPFSNDIEHMTAKKKKGIHLAFVIIGRVFELSERQQERPVSGQDHLYTDIFLIVSPHECSKSRTSQAEN